ncbi:MAG TPA: iron ABC transporter permease [Fibrobacteria bacterium]|nr:iron ABC transporter permease [Fibrobacteria bacterium]
MATMQSTAAYQRLRLVRYDSPAWLAYGALLLFFGLFVIFPIWTVVSNGGLAEWSRVFQNPRWVTALRNTLVMVALSTTTATAVGFLFAYATIKARIPWSPFFKLVALAPLISPPFVGGLSFILLFGRQGLITWHLLGVNFNIYGWHGLWLAQTLGFFPLAFLTLAGTMKALDPTLEQAASSLGARGATLFRSVTLPLLLPGISSAALLVAINVLSDFANPMLIAGNFRVLAPEAYAQVIGWSDYRMASVLATLLFIPTLILFVVQKRIAARRSVITVSGRGSRMAPVPVSPLTKAVLFVLCLMVALFQVAKFAVIFAGAFTKVWGINWSFTLDNFSYALFRNVELWNSLKFGAIAAVCCSVIATLAAFMIYTQRFPFHRALEVATLLPAAVPGTMLGLGYILAFNGAPFHLTGTAAVLILSMIVRYIPVGYQGAASSLRQIDRSIEQSASDLGARTLRAFKDVIVPLLRTAFTGALVYSFVKSINTLSAVIFLVSPGNVVASVSILNLAEQGYWGQAAAFASLLIVSAVLSMALFKLIAGRQGKLFDL